MANKWELFYTFAPVSSCAGVPDGNPLNDINYQTFRVNGGSVTAFGNTASYCPDTEASVRDPMIASFKSGAWVPFGFPVMTDADTIYTNGVLYSPAAAAPTHVISLSLGFVPPELAAYFQSYISEISSKLITKIALPPAPWQYLSTTYDAAANAFNIWLYVPSTAVLTMAKDDYGFMDKAGAYGDLQVRYGFMSPGALQDIYDWFAAWVDVILGILLIIIGVFFTGGVLAIVLLFAGVSVLAWRVYDAVTKQQIAETTATNLDIQLQQTNKATQAASAAESVWQSSTKTQADCTTRLQAQMNIHLSKINGYLNLYAKYANLITELNTELNDFTTKANGIMSAFKAASYAATTCDTYYVQLNDLIGVSDNIINSSLSKYIIPADTYSIACKGWTNQAACEKGGCYWYNSSCNQEEQCWVSNPLGGCILSAKTGKAVLGATAGIILTAALYWLVTRKGEEAKSIYIGAKEAATGEIGRAKVAYSGLTTAVV